ncbi:MAG: hypothetical protein K0Q68_777 [Moraxellaceae bacterium]|jgi:hypothetical protein|nr:hypothetical protein [Moraxellaceae bacterium]
MTLLLCRYSLAFIWIYQGLVPKWLAGPHPDELAMSFAIGATLDEAILIAHVGGALEIALGLALLLWPRQRLFHGISLLVILGFQLALSLVAPGFLVSAFNGMTMHVAIGALSLIAWHELGAKENKCGQESAKPLIPLARL